MLPFAYGSTKTVCPAEMIIAWKPKGVRSKRTVAVGSSTPCPTYVRTSGYSAASGASMIGESHTRKRCNVPSGIGSVTW